ncbi:SixA phosphatase family protein [Paraconexibacter algicola]|uniref:Phosphohistidine phosphatase n=1 Tax=Paraconexibacter algicola TaxID=2133960 RepID=A0A2T4UHJ4_9ACTN|nr:histidine phosphatase family protein [Paraconexibacter algicola]PTL58679.1 phosphohistidine phosphatase [Paraconexibacter algicola]
MSRQLWFLRHGEAEPHGTRADAERRLTARGEDQARAAGQAIAALDAAPVIVFTSPKVRAHDTAALACAALPGDPVVHHALVGLDAGEALALLEAASDGERILLVGHEPDFSQVVHDLTGARIDMKKGGIAVVRMDGSRGELAVLLRPRELRAIAGA